MQKILIIVSIIFMFFFLFGFILNRIKNDVDSNFIRGLEAARFKGASAGLLTIIFCVLAIILTSNTGTAILDILIVYAIYFFTIIGIMLGIHVLVTCVLRSDKRATSMLRELAKGSELYKWVG